MIEFHFHHLLSYLKNVFDILHKEKNVEQILEMILSNLSVEHSMVLDDNDQYKRKSSGIDLFS